MKTFKQFRLDEQDNNEVNKMLQDYVSGKIEDYDNTGSFIELFDPNGRGLPKLLSNFSLSILDKFNDTYKGKDTLIKNKLSFNLGLNGDSTHTKKLEVGLSKTKDGTGYVITSARVQ